MKCIAAKILKITEEIGTIKKSGYNKHQKYAYSNEGDIYEAIKHLLVAHGLAILRPVEDVKFERNAEFSSG